MSQASPKPTRNVFPFSSGVRTCLPSGVTNSRWAWSFFSISAISLASSSGLTAVVCLASATATLWRTASSRLFRFDSASSTCAFVIRNAAPGWFRWICCSCRISERGRWNATIRSAISIRSPSARLWTLQYWPLTKSPFLAPSSSRM